MPDAIWQQRAIHKLKKSEGRGIIWATVGEGKSRIPLRYFCNIAKKPAIVLIVCRRAAFYDWENEIRVCGYHDWMVDAYDPNNPRYFKHGNTAWLISHAMLEKQWASLTWHEQIQYIIFDELYLFSNCKAQRTKSAISLSKNLSTGVIGLSGTIMPARDNTTLWGQTSVIGIQHLLARNLTEFKSRYQTCRLIDMNKGFKIPITKNKPNSKHEILKRLEPFTTLHFPETGQRKILSKFTTVPLTKAQQEIIQQLKVEYYANLPKGRELEIKTATELVIKIQQIANGWIKDSKGFVHLIKTHKTEALQQSVSELLAAGEQCLIWCAFRHDLAILQNLFKGQTVLLQGGQDFNDKAFQSGRYPIVIATEGSGSSINHFKNIQYAKYFSMSFRWLDLQQSRGRTNRKDSQHNSCHYEYFFVEHTMDKHAFSTATQSGSTEADFIKSGILKSWLTN